LGKAAPKEVDRAKCGCKGACAVGFELDFDFIVGSGQFEGKDVQIYGYVINEGPGGKNLPLGGPVTYAMPLSTPPPTPAPTPAPTTSAGETLAPTPVQTEAPTPSPDLYTPQALPACFAPDACDSSLPCCDFCTPLPTGVLCQAGGEGGCKADAVCDGVSPYCPSRVRKDVGEQCDDGNQCTGPDLCTLEGTCFGVPKKGSGCVGCSSDRDCDDGNNCSKDECSNGECTYRVDPSSAGILCRRSRDDSVSFFFVVSCSCVVVVQSF
jgi:hypothetical protein